MDDWRSANCDWPAALVTVAIVEGSGPREPGAKMLVDGARQYGTIGGGHLELRAVELAREMLASGEQRKLERFALGPSLGQCCGGVVHLAFEIVDQAHLALLREGRNEDTWRLVALDGAAESHVVPAQAGTHAECAGQPPLPSLNNLTMGSRRPAGEAGNDGCFVVQDEDGRRWLADFIPAPRNHLVLFGAGHVGAAIVRALADLPCLVTWVDEREDMFPASVPANVTIEATDTPESVVAAAPQGASYLVMTHSHALDQRLAEAILSRPGVGWFGLIGSHTKRMQFEHRLRARGIDPARIAAMVCPIGVSGISGKQPPVIAASVAAQLLQVWEAQAAANTLLEYPARLVASSGTI